MRYVSVNSKTAGSRKIVAGVKEMGKSVFRVLAQEKGQYRILWSREIHIDKQAS